MLPHRNIQSNQGFGFLDMLMTEEELAIEIAQVNRIQINDMYFSEPRKN